MKLTNEIVDERLKGRNIVRLDNYTAASVLMQFQCTMCGNVWKAKWNNISSGKGCPPCSIKKRGAKRRCFFSDMIDHAHNMGGELLSEEYEYQNDRTMLLWKCSKGHEWRARWNNVNPDRKQSTWCNKCARIRAGEGCRLDPEEVRKAIKEKGGNLLSKYRTSGAKLTIECERGHIFKMKWSHITSGHWCPRCTCGNHESTQEIELRCYLQGFYPDIRKEPSGIAVPGRRFEFDIFEPNLKKVIEFDGYWHDKYPERDREKDAAIALLGYEILRIKARDYQKDPTASRLKCLEFLAKQQR